MIDEELLGEAQKFKVDLARAAEAGLVTAIKVAQCQRKNEAPLRDDRA